MRLALSMPAVYKFRAELNDRCPFSTYMKWGWCRLSQMVDLVNEDFDLQFTKADLLMRFGVQRGDECGAWAWGRGWGWDKGLILLDAVRGVTIEFVHITVTSLANIPKLFVPAGWTKNVIFSILHGARRFARTQDNGELQAVNEAGDLVMFW